MQLAVFSSMCMLVIRLTYMAKICLTYWVALAYFNIEIDACTYICSVVISFTLF